MLTIYCDLEKTTVEGRWKGKTGECSFPAHVTGEEEAEENKYQKGVLHDLPECENLLFN